MQKYSKNLKYLTGIIILAIIAISTLLHFSIHITDALTVKPAEGFDIHVSIWRILFEPILGLMLFFNRGVYAIEEMQFTLYWVLIIFIGYSVYRFIAVKDKQAKKSFLFAQLANLPLVIGLWFTFFVIILFMSSYLPSNTIVNNSANTILVTTHAHTQFSHDGLISQERLWKWHKYNNFDAFFITDHNTHSQTLDFLKSQRAGNFPIKPLVMAGEEFSGSNHLSLLGLKRDFDTHGYSDSTVIDSVRANNGAVIVNHWFDGEHMSLEYYKNLGVDGFEIENTATETSYNRKVYHKIKDFCEQNSLIMNVGLDFHGYGNVCSAWNGMEIPGWHELSPEKKEEAILNVIKSRDQSKLKVLMYTDRPFYTDKHLFWSPVFTFFNYFRTLNFAQVASWVFWILLFAFIYPKISGIEKFEKIFNTNNVLAVLGMLGAFFMLWLGFSYHSEIQNVLNSDNDVYEEYSTILFSTGSAFLIYSAVVAFFRFKKQTNKNS